MFNDVTFFSWLLGASLSLVVLWIVFSCFFRSWTFFVLNRWILIGGTFACLLFPLIAPDFLRGLFSSENLSPYPSFDMPNLVNLRAAKRAIGTGPTSTLQFSDWSWPLIVLIYWLGVALMVIRSLKAFAQLRAIHLEADLLSRDETAITWAQSRLPTFSFGRNIFLNVHTLSLPASQLATVRRHEEAHVLQMHSADNIFFELVSAIFWFNPFVGKLFRYLRDVHEFLADRWAVSGDQVTDYQQLLVTLAAGRTANRITHTFSNSQFFRRIAMLNKPKTNAMESLKLLLLVPAAATAMFLSACVDQGRTTPATPQSVIVTPTTGPVISKITWTGIHAHSESELNKLLAIKVGDRYEPSQFRDMLVGRTGSVTSLYMNEGYLFFYTDIAEKLVGDKIELTLNVKEDERVWINDVILTVKSGEKSMSDDVRPLLDVKKGQLFNRELLFSSQEKLAKSGLVRPDSVQINPLPLPEGTSAERRLMDIEFVVQKP